MDEISIRSHWVSAWSTSPIDASLSETGILDRLGVAVTDVSARTAVQLTAGGTHVRLTLSNVFGVLPLHVAAFPASQRYPFPNVLLSTQFSAVLS